jgi:hypothetical protein
VRGGQVLDPLARLRGLLPRGHGDLAALGVGGGFGFGRPQRREPVIGVAAAQFGVGGHSQVPLLHGGLVPVSPVVHGGGEHGFALPVSVVQGMVASGQFMLAGSFGMSAALLGGVGFGAGEKKDQNRTQPLEAVHALLLPKPCQEMS